MIKKLLILFFFFGYGCLNAKEKRHLNCEKIEVLTGQQPLSNRLKSVIDSAMNALIKEAKKEGLSIEIVSHYRNFEHQKRIWNRKYKQFTEKRLTPTEAIKKIIQYSTIPGTSRHHWYTDFDIVLEKEHTGDRLLAKHFDVGGMYQPLHLWLQKNAKKFRFALVYTNKKGRKGFAYEPWHYSYTTFSYDFLRCYSNINIKTFIQSLDIMGKEYITDKIVEKYISENIFDINPILVPDDIR